MNWEPLSAPEIAPPEPSEHRHGTHRKLGEHEVRPYGEDLRPRDTAAEAAIIAQHLFATKADAIDAVDYAIQYKFGSGFAGGDVADVYEFDNGSVAFTAADVEGRGTQAAALAALVKLSLRAYASVGMTPEAAMRQLNQLYVENCIFEKIESFASAFFALIDAERKTLSYCSAGHDIAVLMRPGEAAHLLPVTAPVVGVFIDNRDFFRQRCMELLPGSVLIGATDGITEARDSEGRLFGTKRLIRTIEAHRLEPATAIVERVIEAALRYNFGEVRDDIAVFAARFH